MADIDWMLDDLRILRDRFREARRMYPGLISKFAEFPYDDRNWHVEGWQMVNSFAALHEVDIELSPYGKPSVNYLYLRMAETCLARAMEAGWDLRAAVTCFGQLSMATVSTFHLYEVTRIMSERFWWNRDERAWIAWLHWEARLPAHEENAVGRYAEEIIYSDESKRISAKVPVTQINDVFEASCRLLDQMIGGLQDLTNPLQLAGGAPPKDDAAQPVVILHPPHIKFRGTLYQLSANGALFLQFLVRAKGDWTAGSKMDMRADRVKASLPESIRDLVESAPGKGYRLSRSFWDLE